MSNVRILLPHAREFGLARWKHWKWMYRAGMSPAGIVILIALLAKEATDAKCRFSRKETAP